MSVQGAYSEAVRDYLGLKRWADATPLSPALCTPDRIPLTYSGLWDHITSINRALIDAAIGPDEVVVLALPNGAVLATAILAITCQWACMALDLDLAAGETRTLLERLNASTLVYEEDVASPAPQIARQLGMRLVRIHAPQDGAAGSFLIDRVDDPSGDKPRRRVDAAILFHTSATTGIPKLVPLRRENLRAAAGQDALALQLTAADRFLSLMPLCHAHGMCAIFSQLSCGGCVWCGPSFEPSQFLKSFVQFRPTWFSASPAAQKIILQLAQNSPEILKNNSLRFVRSAGSALDRETLHRMEEMFRVPVLEGYGLTEAPCIARNRLGARKEGSAGKAAGTAIAILSDAGSFLPPETIGEIVLNGPTLMSGYLDDAEANRAAFHEAWFRTGDLGQIDRDGFLFIVGRHKEMINRSGKKVFPQEVDAVLAAHPAVAEAATFAVPHRTLGEDVAAAVILRPHAVATELELRRFVAERMASFKVPRRIVFLEKIPRTASGKSKRNEVAAEFLRRLPARQPHPAASARSLTRLEEQLSEIWRRVLGVDQVEVDDDFFDIGGNSLSTALMLHEVAQKLQPPGRVLDLSNFFLSPTIGSLAGLIVDGLDRPAVSNSRSSRLFFLRKQGNRAPLFCFTHSEDSPHHFQNLVRWLAPDQPFAVVCPPPSLEDGRLLSIEDSARECAASIRAANPGGPYLLAGYCFGGVVAFETARQLVEDGCHVALLALFDCPAPGYPKVVREWKGYARQGALAWRAFSRGKSLFSAAEIKAHLRTLAALASRKMRAKASKTLSTAGLVQPQAEAPARSVVREEYVPRALDAPVVHFIGTDVAVSSTVLSDPRLGWKDFALRGFEASSVPGDHVSIFSAANAPALATKLEMALAAYSTPLAPPAPSTDAGAREAGRPAVLARAAVPE